jgi:glutathione synthase/RimK-type ligase-like ATP-grasp enzyme
MKILITCPRAPVALEWGRILQESNHSITFVDSLQFPLSTNLKGSSYIKISSPKENFNQYKSQIESLVSNHDITIPTCEDIFYVSQVFQSSNLRKKIFIPDHKLLMDLHNKFHFAQYMNKYVEIPKTKQIYSVKEINYKEKTKTILKPVYSRFGLDVIRNISKESIKDINISNQYPWVQQEYINGTYLCNFAIIQNGKIIDHIVYEPKYLFNNSASTYFRKVINFHCEKFIEQFAKDTQYTGQIAFDFIENEQGLYVIECNPRATSGIHLMKGLNLDIQGKFNSNKTYFSNARLGNLPYLTCINKLSNAKILSQINKDISLSHNALKGISLLQQLTSTGEILVKSLKHRISLTAATTIDIEYNG